MKQVLRNRILKVVIWSVLVILASIALAVLAFKRGEPVNALWMVVASFCVFAIGYRFHSAWLMAKVLTVDEMRSVPSVVKADGKDFVSTNRYVVFGHHFAAIAGPGPLVGPVLAAQFGYLPGLLWMLIGATLGGAVHDSVILFSSIRRGGKSLGQMVKEEVGPFAGLAALIGILGIMVILLAVLGLVIVKSLTNSPWGVFTITATIPIALVMGIGMRLAGQNNKSITAISIIGLVALIGSVWAGQLVVNSAYEKYFIYSGTQLAWILMIYGFVASIIPVWLLLAPRDYLSSFMKIGIVGLLGVAIIILAPVLRMPALTTFIDGTGPVFAGTVFPFCFITIACAAVSGFHSIIASGTTPKLLAKESDIRMVAYGAMVTEMCVGVMALIAACAMQPGEYLAINMAGDANAVVAKATALGFPVTSAQMDKLALSVGEKTMIGRTGGAPTFAIGMAELFSAAIEKAHMGKSFNHALLSLWYHFAIMFEVLFILTTLDAGTRVGRFLVQDLLGYRWEKISNTNSAFGGFLATFLFVAAWGYFLYQGVIDPLGGINSLWPIFGVGNQLLAVIALAFGTTILIKMKRIRYLWVTLAPLGWLLSVTFSAGLIKIFSNNPKLGFLSAAHNFQSQLAAATNQQTLSFLKQQILNNYIDACVTGVFLALVVIVVIANARVWIKLLLNPEQIKLNEDPYVPVAVNTV